MAKVRLDEIDEMMDEWEEDQMGDPGLPPHELLQFRKDIAQTAGVEVKDIRITWCGPVNEYCIYIKNKWSGYLEWTDIPYDTWEHDAELNYYQTKV